MRMSNFEERNTSLDSVTRKALLCVALVAAAVAIFLVWSSGALTPPNRVAPLDAAAAGTSAEKKKNSSDPSAAPSNIFIGHQGGPERKIHTIFTTRKKEVTYQALIRYEPRTVNWDEAPGRADLMQLFARQGRDLPPVLRLIEQETEMLSQNLGEPLRFVTSIKYYLNPIDGRVLGYDMAQTTGAQSQRMVGHLTKTGVAIDVYRGGQLADRQDIGFVRDTFIPVEYEFMHQWFQQPANAVSAMRREPIKFSIFVPEAMMQVLLVIKPLEDERISVADATYWCSKYEVLTVSTQSSEGLFARQEMWFDKESGRMMRRQDFDASLEQADAPVTEREPYQRIDELKRLGELVIKPPAVPYKPADFLLDQDMDYAVTAAEKSLGRLKVRFARLGENKQPPFVPQDQSMPVGCVYFSTGTVNMDTGGTLRDEVAVTLYDSKWNALAYETRGQEKAGAKRNYRIAALIGGGKLNYFSHREVVPELKFAALHTAALIGFELGTRAAASSDSEWRDPLRRVPVSDDDAAAQQEEKAPRLADQSWSRAFPDGTFISDFNRLEHLAVLACRFPLPPPPEKSPAIAPAIGPNAPPALPPLKVAFQKAALYLIRQNRCAVLLFEIGNEHKPKLTERQIKRQSDEEKNEPPLFVASASAAMMPCRMLLDAQGRILELTMKYGGGDVTYTLDDPIMRRRAERARMQRIQEGPRLVRPPWY